MAGARRGQGGGGGGEGSGAAQPDGKALDMLTMAKVRLGTMERKADTTARSVLEAASALENLT